MKANRQEKHHEPCYRSLEVLKEQVESYFEKQGTRFLWFPDDPDWDKIVIKEDEVYDVVFFGNFLRGFLESGLWPFKRVRLWCLSSVVQKYLETHMLGGQFKVGLIERKDLFPIEVKPKSASLKLLYAGRISESKNIPLLLAVYHQLDQHPELGASLDLFGEFDDEISENYGRRVHTYAFRERLEKWIASKKWNNAPSFHGPKKTEEWLDFAINKTFITLSDYYAEDFGVAVAQAQVRGIPVIVSEWGGHIDVEQAYLKIPAELLCFGIEDESLLQMKAQKISDFIRFPGEIKEQQKNKQEGEVSVISVEELAKCRNEMSRKWGTTLLWSQRVGLGYLADHDRGASFVQKYNDSMSGGEISFEVIFIFTDIDRGELNKQEWEKCHKFLLENPKRNLHFLSERDLFKKDQLEVCQRTSQIVYLGSNDALFSKLQDFFGAKVLSL